MVTAAETESVQNTKPWLTAEYYKDILDKEFGKYEILDFQVTNATAKGDNYASVMNRVSVDLKLEDGTDKTIKFIVKSEIQSELSSNLLGSLAVFPKEIEMYDTIMPKMKAIYEDAGMDIALSAKCYKTQKNPAVIVLEDLSVDGFENINRLEGMDMKHVEKTLDKLAKFHAASARVHELKGAFPDLFSRGLYTPEMIGFIQQMAEKQWPTMLDGIREWGGCEKFIEPLELKPEKISERFLKPEEINPDEFNVLNHGDMWCNNIMFKHGDNGCIEDLKFVDLQLCKWGSPVLDLQYFIVTSCAYNIRIAKHDYFVKYYHEQLIKNLKLVKYEGKLPKLVDLHIQMLKRGYYSINIAFGTLTAVLMDPAEATDMETLMDQSEASVAQRRKSFMAPRYSNAVKSILEFAYNRGVLA